MRVYSWGSMIYVKIDINIDTIQKGIDWIGSLDNNEETFSEHQKKVISLLQNENIPFNIRFEIGLYILNNTNSARQYINVSVMLDHLILRINDPKSREIQFTSKTVIDIINWWNENKINYSKN